MTFSFSSLLLSYSGVLYKALAGLLMNHKQWGVIKVIMGIDANYVYILTSRNERANAKTSQSSIHVEQQLCLNLVTFLCRVKLGRVGLGKAVRSAEVLEGLTDLLNDCALLANAQMESSPLHQG